MNILRQGVLALLLMSLVLTTGEWGDRARPDGFKARRKAREVPGPVPSDWFLMQRAWPEGELRTEDYLAAVHQADRLRRHSTLDDQPPWMPAGPTNIGGRVADVVSHPANDNIWYVAAASGGIFKTTNAGQNWQAVFDEMPSLSMGALAIDLAHPDTIYAGTGEPCSATNSYFGTGVYRTTDGGQSWSHLGLENSQYIARIALEPGNPQGIWVASMGEVYTTGGQRGVFHSSNGGATWVQSLFVNDSTGASDLVVHPTNAQIAYAATWQRIRNPAVRAVGGRGSGIWRTTNGGQNWERLQDGLPPVANNVGRIGLAISRSHPDTLFAIYADDPGAMMGIYRSNNGGDTWSRVNDEMLADLYVNFGWYFGNIRIRPDNPNIVFALGVDLARSTDGGANWDIIAWGVHVDHHALWFHPAQPTQLLLGNDGGLYRSTNNGNSWTFRPGLPINQFYAAAVDPQIGSRRYGGTQDNGTLRTLTGATGDYDHIHGGDGFYCLVDPTNSNTIYAEYQWGWLEKSTNGGDSWMDLLTGIDENDRTNWCTPFEMDPTNRQTLYYGSHRLYRTTNGGVMWNPISGDLTDGGGQGNLTFGTITTIGVSPVNPSVLWVGTDDANVWVSTNGGQNWQNRSAGLPQRWVTRVTPDPWAAGTVYVTISGFRNSEDDAHLFRSTDYGQTWQNIGAELPAGPLNDVIPDPLLRGRLYAASDFGTFVSPDSGGNWTVLGENLPRVPVLDLVLHNPSRQLVAATYGRSMFTLDLQLMELNQPPQITSSTPAGLDTIPAGQTVQFAVTAQDADGDTLSYRWTRGGAEIGTSTSVEITFDQPNVTERITIEVSDGEFEARHQWNFFVAQPGAADDERPRPAAYGLAEIYPNPFNSSAIIEYSLPQAGNVEITVFDLTGRRVATLLRGTQPAGQGRLTWQARNLSSGTYLIRLQAGHQHLIRKALLIR